MDVREIKAIDIHTHIDHGTRHDSPNEEKPYYTAFADKLIEMETAANIRCLFASTFSSVLSVEDVEEENEYMFRTARDNEIFYQWVVIDPRNDATFRQADRMLQTDKCVGIKLHPVCHKYAIADYAEKLFGFSSERGATVLIHPEERPVYLVPFADRYPETTFIAAHLGGKSWGEAIKAAKHKNLYADTSGIASSLNQIVEYTVGQVGSERILFGTDTYAAGFQRGRIEYALISDEDKANILRNNALRLFGAKLKR